ncbi:type IV pilin [Halanaeroarchaeum sp. HSR-CO]|uniref:type IV pilin n=1 Tax=Halanaeroarchaeum sp. HSR-CO TaxID=2866382 RepID=UPI0037C08CCF
MVAITVILAAVIGTFVLGLGENVSTSTPQAQLTLSADQSNISVEHKGGDAIPAEEISITVSSSSNSSVAEFDPNSDATQELTVGDTGTLDIESMGLYWPDQENNVAYTNGNTTLESGTAYTVQIVHEPSDQLIMDRTVRP